MVISGLIANSKIVGKSADGSLKLGAKFTVQSILSLSPALVNMIRSDMEGGLSEWRYCTAV